jgi:hypothetical protein
MARQPEVEVTVPSTGAVPSPGILTPIGSRKHPTFVPHRVLAAPGGPEILAAVADLRHRLKPYEPRVFAWLQAAPGNPEEYARDPFRSLHKLGIEIDPGTRAQLDLLGELLKRVVHQGEG